MNLSYRNQKNAEAVSNYWCKPLDRPDWFKVNAETGDDAEILIFDAIGWPFNDAGNLIRAIADMRGRAIKVRINSPGGDVFDAVAIFNALQGHSAKVTTRIESLAASAASLLALSGKEVQAYPNSMMMLHYPWTIAMGNEFEFEEIIDILRPISKNMIDMYAENSKIGKKEVAALMKGDGKKDGTWLTAKEMKEKGFINTIIDGNAAKAQFDLSMFDNAPDDLVSGSNEGKELTEREIERALREAGASRSFAKSYIAGKPLRDAGEIGAVQNLISKIQGVFKS